MPILLTLISLACFATDEVSDCNSLDDDQLRLNCYDNHYNKILRNSPLSTPSAAGAGNIKLPLTGPDSSYAKKPEPKPAVQAAANNTNKSLSALWELDKENKQGTFRLLQHRQIYLLPVHYTTSINSAPESPAEKHVVNNEIPLQSTETKFQYSFKFKAFENLFNNTGDVWFAYTQQSHWQIFNTSKSSQFRETDYEPEVILSLKTNADIMGWHWRLLNLGYDHQSNGRSLPLSRSWNRLYAQFGLEHEDFTLLVRPWLRLPERSATDDNPDIERYFGSGDIVINYVHAGHVYSLLERYSPSGQRGMLQFEWAFPLSGELKGFVQASSGYGESLIDYNHFQNTIGIGLLLLPWR